MNDNTEQVSGSEQPNKFTKILILCINTPGGHISDQEVIAIS